MTNASPIRLYSQARPDPAAPVSHDDRGEERKPVSAGAVLLSQQNATLPVALSDLSRHGCCIEGATLSLRPGQFISIKLAKLEYLQAIVRWAEGDRAGIEFTRALHPAVFEYHLQQMLPE